MGIFIPNMHYLCLGGWEGSAQMMMMMTTKTTHDGQSMTVQGSLVDKPNEPKTWNVL